MGVSSSESVAAPPHPALAGLVGEYAEFSERAGGPVVRYEPANAGAVLVVEFADPLVVADVAEPAVSRTWRAFVAGPSLGPTRTEHAGVQHCVEVRLTPLGLYRMAGNVSELADRAVGLGELFGREGGELSDRIAAQHDSASRFAVLDALFGRAAADGREPDPEVSYAWYTLRRTGGTAPIAAIRTEIGWSRARLARRFRAQVGLTPKAAARVIRFGRAAALLRAPDPRPLAAIALSCGYADQAHFTRDFREFAGRPPGTWAADQGSPAPRE
ncbi:helix-turn-helix domain-containing protein [Nocardia asteroides]|uniref:helix-turn-helix domain-containing protein n=1 Tax=Nocardia asteroides TaxID=1824 RepID=UPI001E2FC6C8|nr:helix-turn-helix domain-containing protein [Nocardia asteroides]UGT60086.1 helix-turn-helix domain-containing protein [Nocardia asteroides]